MVVHFILGLIVGVLIIFGGPLTAGFLAMTVGPEFGIYGIAVPIVIVLFLTLGNRNK